MLANVLRFIAIAYVVLGMLALLMIPASVYGWFGVAPDPLSGVLALLLSLPWSLILRLLNDPGPVAAVAVCALGIVINGWLIVRLSTLLAHKDVQKAPKQ